MVSEKFEAMSESAKNTSETLGHMLLNPAAVLVNPAAMMNAFVSLSSTAAGPYQRRLNSNAKRLQSRGS